MGGASSEREVSLVTGAAVVKNLDKKKYAVAAIEMTREGHFVIRSGGKQTNLDFINTDRKRFDCIFIALHGSPGEDGAVQGMFESLGIPYTGSKTLSSALAMNKVKTGELYRMYNIPTPQFIFVDIKTWKKNASSVLASVAKHFSFPVIVKPSDQGSAVGVSLVKSKKDLESTLRKTFRLFPHLLIQHYIRGQEATCGVLEIRGKAKALPPTHILANLDEFYDYNSKYKPGGSTHVCPADFPKKINAAIQDLALRAHGALGCSGMSRTDILVDDHNALWVLETNTIPGMTPTSLFPEAAAKAGIPFNTMLDYIIQGALVK